MRKEVTYPVYTWEHVGPVRFNHVVIPNGKFTCIGYLELGSTHRQIIERELRLP
jgi:hypothetical protein